MTFAGWLFDLLGIRAITDSLASVLPQRQTLRFIGALVADNITLGSTDVTISRRYQWGLVAAPAVNAVRYPSILTNLANATEPSSQFVVEQPFTANYLSFMCGANALATDTVVVTLRKNAADTALTFTIPAGTAVGTIISDSAHSVDFARGDKISLKVLQSGTTAQASWAGIFQVG